LAQKKKRTSKTSSPALPDVRTVPGAREAPYPGFIEPALATLRSRPPSGEKWIHELKLDGYRTQAHVAEGDAQVFTRRGNDWSKRFKRIAEEIRRLPVQSLIIDGEVVAVDEKGRVNFGLLQSDLGSGRTDRLVYYAFDILYLNGYDLRKVTQIERKKLLLSLFKTTERFRVLYSEHFEIEGERLYTQVCNLGMEGIVSKLRDASYQSGRNDCWLKTKCSKKKQLPIIGFKPDRSGIAALYVGRWSDNQLTYAGKVGTGFSLKTSHLIRDVLNTVITETPPVPGLKKPKVIWVRPEFEAEVQYTEVTSDGLMRHPSFRRLEPAKPPPLPAVNILKPARENIMRVLPDAVAPSAEELKAYWKSVHRRALKHMGGRPLTVVRNIGGTVFFTGGRFRRCRPASMR
jgi:bifunctional non-homologous end joining protein LigD